MSLDSSAGLDPMTTDLYRRCDGIYVPPIPVVHRDDEYDSMFCFSRNGKNKALE